MLAEPECQIEVAILRLAPGPPSSKLVITLSHRKQIYCRPCQRELGDPRQGACPVPGWEGEGAEGRLIELQCWR